MRYFRGPCFWLGIFAMVVGLASGCESRSLPEQRFAESAALSAPAFAPTVPDPDNFSFAVVGDLHVGGGDTERLGRIVDGAQAAGDSFLVLLGDSVDRGLRSDFEAILSVLATKGWDDKTVFAVGNHDVFGGGWEHYKELIGPSHFSFTAGNAKFIVLDTADATVGDAQGEWLRSELENHNATHVFILAHYLPVIPGVRTYLKLANEAEALSLMKLALRHGVRGWLGGHYHSFVQGEVEGVDYLVAGGGGGRRMPPVEQNFYVQARVSGTEVTYTMKAVP